MFTSRLKEVQTTVQVALDAAVARQPEGPLRAPMHYALQGGKRLRAFLAIESAAIFGIPEAQVMPAAAAVEALHAYSLVHDDLPCMDDDDLRRGQPTVHVKWDEATAVLTGDVLQTLAFELCADPVLGPAERRIALSLALAKASGAAGMGHGQALDIAAESATDPLSLSQITALQAGKTGALISFASRTGAILAGEDEGPLSDFADAVGLAFQIHDDILDVTGCEKAAGKRVGKDAEAGKATFVSLLGLAGAQLREGELIEQAIDALSPYGEEAENLRAAARFVISREM
ncbi:polyprenyl synthetase family protein [Thioclava sp. F28-4]|uniref:polyprenyl synthetase family protein n=1 Tax=Thioclava sp. F28-4 TaxID=1915315 RepID=UPI0009984B03|nr:polyprenyl synthetase family protein [Thioclava sp. F28-4]OOY04106.1 farnesyl-diphosphate synthase [Thioclava sp. F28-4]